MELNKSITPHLTVAASEPTKKATEKPAEKEGKTLPFKAALSKNTEQISQTQMSPDDAGNAALAIDALQENGSSPKIKPDPFKNSDNLAFKDRQVNRVEALAPVRIEKALITEGGVSITPSKPMKSDLIAAGKSKDKSEDEEADSKNMPLSVGLLNILPVPDKFEGAPKSIAFNDSDVRTTPNNEHPALEIYSSEIKLAQALNPKELTAANAPSSQNIVDAANQRLPIVKFETESKDFSVALKNSLTKSVEEPLTQAPIINAPSALVSEIPKENIIRSAVGVTEWQKEIGNRVILMSSRSEQSVTLHLNPPGLGPLQVVVSVGNEKTDAQFFSNNPDVRKALEDGMSNLREMMKGSGIELGQSNVSDQQSGEKRSGNNEARSNFDSAPRGLMEAETAARETLGREIKNKNENIISTFA